MKRFLLVILALLLLISSAGCGSYADTSTETEHSHNHEHEYIPNPNAADSQQTATSDTKDYPESLPNTARGVAEGDTYTNNYLQLKLTIPENWVFLPEDAVKSRGEEYDMMATDHSIGAGIFLAFENLRLTTGSVIDAKEYVDTVLKPGIDNTPYSSFVEQTEIQIGDNTYVKVVIATHDNNNPLTKYIYLREVDGFMAQIIATVPTAKAEELDFDSMLS